MDIEVQGEGLSLEELQLAARNHGMPLEALRWDVTPVGLHYLLVHYDIPAVDPAGWRLEIGGHVRRPLSLSLDDLRSRPRTTLAVTMECAGNGRALLSPRPRSQPWLAEAVGTAEWTGTLLAPLLAEAGPLPGGVEVAFRGLDRGVEGGVEQRYERSLPLAEAAGGEVLVADEVNGAPLPPQHGAPARLVVPGWYGMASVKWLAAVTVLDTPFRGYQMEQAYRWRVDEDDPGEPLTRMRARALMVPPGIPDFFTRARLVPLGPCLLEGRAWSGGAPVVRVEVSADGGATWAVATLGEPRGRWAWRAWRHRWEPPAPGAYVLCCRAFDAAGAGQPLDPLWNVGGYANNAVQRVVVTVTA
jgi:DMSO/TMAO reductase YedYZ molybdopterin-dependent catalytic subunit